MGLSLPIATPRCNLYCQVEI